MHTDKACHPTISPPKNLAILAKPFNDITNISFSAGKFPNSMKIANIMPAYKKFNKLNCNNNITLLPNLSKIFKKLIHQRLTTFLEFNQIFFNYWFGFQNKHSTFHALFSLTEQTRKALDTNKFTYGIFIAL